jgi:hypothetical protein
MEMSSTQGQDVELCRLYCQFHVCLCFRAFVFVYIPENLKEIKSFSVSTEINPTHARTHTQFTRQIHTPSLVGTIRFQVLALIRKRQLQTLLTNYVQAVMC